MSFCFGWLIHLPPSLGLRFTTQWHPNLIKLSHFIPLSPLALAFLRVSITSTHLHASFLFSFSSCPSSPRRDLPELHTMVIAGLSRSPEHLRSWSGASLCRPSHFRAPAAPRIWTILDPMALEHQRRRDDVNRPPVSSVLEEWFNGYFWALNSTLLPLYF